MSNEKKEKLSIKRLIENMIYVLRYALQMNKKIVFLMMFSTVFSGVISAAYGTYFLKFIIDFLSNKEITLRDTLILIFVGVFVNAVGNATIIGVEQWSRAKIIKTNGQIQSGLIKKASEMDLLYYDNQKYFDDFVIAASQAEEMIENGILSCSWLLRNIIIIITLSVLVLTINPIMAIFPLLGFVVNIITRFKITKLEYDYNMLNKKIMRKADYSKRVFYQPEYAKEIKLSDITTPLKAQFESAIQEVTKEAHKAGIKIAIYSLINWITVFTFLSYFCSPMYLGYLALVKRNIALGDVAALNNAQTKIRNQLDGMNYALVEFQKVGQYAERFRRFMEYEVNIEDYIGNTALPSAPALLEIRNMSFRYPSEQADTLTQINMTIHPGEKIAIVGENGAGKTTFVKLLMRLYDVTDGSINYGGTDLRSFSTKDYRGIIGAVFQDYQIYGATLGENVLMDDYTSASNEDHITSQEDQIRKALSLADFDQKLNKLPQGIHTEMTREFAEEGTMLSGGESQKVAISRMFAQSGRLSISILDEPSSALDPLAEYTLNRNMMENAKDSTIIFISHRLSTTKDADRIYMFEHGRIIEEGTHDKLMAKNGQYAYMFEKQAYYYQEEI